MLVKDMRVLQQPLNSTGKTTRRSIKLSITPYKQPTSMGCLYSYFDIE